MAKRLIQGPAMPVWLVDGDGNPITALTLVADTEVSITSQLGRAVYCNEPAVNTAAVVTMGAFGAGSSNVIGMVAWSYDAAPTAGSLTITDGGAQVFKIDITTSGPGFIPFNPPMRFTDNSAVVVTLAGAGAAVSGIVNVHGWIES